MRSSSPPSQRTNTFRLSQRLDKVEPVVYEVPSIKPTTFRTPSMDALGLEVPLVKTDFSGTSTTLGAPGMTTNFPGASSSTVGVP
jgi:hypothetical protein